MARILSLFLVILVMNNQVMSFDIFGIDFKTIMQAYNYINLVYTKGVDYANRDIIAKTNPAQQLRNILAEIRTISKQLINFENVMDEKMDVLGMFLLNNIGTMSDFSTARSELVQHINDVNFLFKKGMELKENGNYNIATIKSFVNSALSDTNNLEHSLFEIYKIVLPGMNTNIRKGLITLAAKYTQENYERLCNKHSSPQQHMYYVFMIILRTHLRGFTTLTQAYSIRTLFDNSSYVQEYKDTKQRFQNQLTNYIKAFMQDLNYFRVDIHKCDIKNPVIGENVYEMEGLFQVIVNYESTMKSSALYAQGTPFCGDCEEIKNHYVLRNMINNCKSYASVKGCPVSEITDRTTAIRYLWYTADSETFGHKGQCNYSLYETNRYFGSYWCFNDICECSVNISNANYIPRGRFFLQIDAPKIMRISVEPQLSDIANNMVVVGVKFTLRDNAIHLQILQSKITKKRAVHEEAVWKPVHLDNKNKTINITHDNVYYERNSFHLDDVMVHPDFIVTGVKLSPNKKNDGFELHVHATKYDPETGLLSGPEKWFEPGEFSPNPQDYQRNSTKITMDDPDDPTIMHTYHSDPESNKYIQFQHTSVKKDAGFHTVPFFDGQPVESLRFPLGGVGLFYRQRDGFGGYIAPRLLTYNITWEMESSFNNWQKIEKAYEKCNLEVPPSVTAIDENTTCESLRQTTLNTQHNSTENDVARNTIIKQHN
ncbi:hypothetical protein PV327_008999 [Microctonus hyperodae]|uniref:Uncharacterized protein n=1 Tax=Microctonus hyperodae TaxID=165561 RepID=A0AA39FT57_MICHY|nr:hypothetical protein PV327_008999 [Microctonus hyperodae]